MPYPAAPLGTCPACDLENVKLRRSSYVDEGVLVCAACVSAARKAATAAGKKRTAPLPGAGQDIIGQVVDYAANLPEQIPTAVATGHSNGRAVGLLVVCYEVADLRKALQLTDGMDVRLHHGDL